MKLQFSNKRIQISRANAQMVAIVAVAAFITTFSLIASHALIGKRAYQNRVIEEKEKAVSQLEENLRAIERLVVSYEEFMNRPQNIIGGNPAGTGSRDGDNAKIILDALPSKYDFPAVTSSIEKLVQKERLRLESITGMDDEVAQRSTVSPHPEPIEIPFEFTVVGNYSSMQNLLRDLELSIRPFQVVRLVLKGSDTETTMTLTAKTYYLPAKSLGITKRLLE